MGPESADSLPPPSRQAPRRLWALGAVLVAGLFGGQWWYAHERYVELQEQTAKRLAQTEAQLQEGRGLARADHESLAALQNKVGLLEARLAETQSQAVALAAMYQDIVRSRDERLLAEIEQSIAIAAQQLQLAGNAEAALIALQSADARLAGTTQARFLPLRRLIARDIERLRSLPAADISGLALKIETVAAVVDSLPLAFAQRPQAEPPPRTKPAAAEPGVIAGVAAEIWRELRQLVRIERIDRGDPALLAPTQVFFLRENLRLRLLAARLALLQRETRSYREELRQVQDLLERYFDTSARPVQTALGTVKRAADAKLSLDLPALTETLNAARNLKLPRDKAG